MLLPDARRRGEIHFVLARSLPYNIRLAMIAAVLFAGFVFQLYVNMVAGSRVPVSCHTPGDREGLQQHSRQDGRAA